MNLRFGAIGRKVRCERSFAVGGDDVFVEMDRRPIKGYTNPVVVARDTGYFDLADPDDDLCELLRRVGVMHRDGPWSLSEGTILDAYQPDGESYILKRRVVEGQNVSEKREFVLASQRGGVYVLKNDVRDIAPEDWVK